MLCLLVKNLVALTCFPLTSCAILLQVPRSLIVVVFGDTTENLETFAASLKSRDIQIFVIAVGVNAPSPNHIALAREGTNVHTLNSVDDLKSLSARLAKDTCNGNPYDYMTIL